MDREAWLPMGFSPWGCKESDMTEHVRIHWCVKSPLLTTGSRVAGFRVWHTLKVMSRMFVRRVWYLVNFLPVCQWCPLTSSTDCTWWGVNTPNCCRRVSLDTSLTGLLLPTASSAIPGPPSAFVLESKPLVSDAVPAFGSGLLWLVTTPSCTYRVKGFSACASPDTGALLSSVFSVPEAL